MQVLIAFPKRDQDLADEIDERLLSAARERVLSLKPAQFAADLVKAKLLCEAERGQFSHCIVHDELPLTRSTELAAGGALELARYVRSQGWGLPILLFHTRASWSDEDMEEMTRLGIRSIRNSERGIASVVQQVLTTQITQNTIEITIDLSRSPSAYQISNCALPLQERQGEVRLNAVRLKTCKFLSKKFEEDDDWNEPMTTLSLNLWDSLVAENQLFRAALRQVLREDAYGERSRVHFRVNEQQYEVAFETIQAPEDESFWMLRTPVFRSLAIDTGQPAVPIFEGLQGRPLKCLIVLSEAAGVCRYMDKNGQVEGARSYPDLKCARAECRELLQFLGAQDGTRKARPVPIGYHQPLTGTELKDALTAEAWDLVHYIGHTDFRDPRGFLILPGEGPAQAEAVGIEEIAPHLANTRFLYLSSCEGTRLDFVRRLARHGVPAVLGFRSKVPDELAYQHALYFYRQLFEVGSIERAFLAARKEFHKTNPKERLWACSSLIMQQAQALS